MRAREPTRIDYGSLSDGRVPAEITGLRILVTTRPDLEADRLVRELRRTRSEVHCIWPMPELLAGDADVAFCDLSQDLPRRLPGVPGATEIALVLMLPASSSPDLELIKSCTPDAVLHRPLTAPAILVSLLEARTHFTYERRLRSRIDKLDETLRSVRAIERAKAILVEMRHMDEEGAYRFLRQQAMNKRVSIGAVATAIVASHEILR